MSERVAIAIQRTKAREVAQVGGGEPPSRNELRRVRKRPRAGGGEALPTGPRSSAPRLAAPTGALTSLSARGGGGALEHVEDPEPTRSTEQVWDDELKVFVPEDEPTTVPADLEQRRAAFEEALALVRDGVGTSRCQVFPSLSPHADWRGIHFPDHTVLINVALVKTVAGIAGVIVHELAHESASAHDVRFVQTEDALHRLLLAHLLARRG